ncbi:MAG TPA: PA2169 family four-helix-bundle protein [Phycisphaerae bacterium]|nr:PA2169 family four-helix-bundle protein [Phycisphaerae bacterium]
MNTYSLDTATLDRLQDLLSINIDSQKGFQEVSEHVKDAQLKQLFAEFSQKRAHNAAELRQAISNAGSEPHASGSVTGTLHRWWIDAKQAFSGASPESVLAEAERGEDSIKHTYEEALLHLSPTPARDLVERQFQNVTEGHNRVKSLRESYKHRNPSD